MLKHERALPSKAVNQGQHSMLLRGKDFYPTDSRLTNAFLLSGEPLPHVLLEPACGMGHMAKPLMGAGHEVICSDIEDYGWPGQQAQIDFFDIKATDAQAIITNPPFSESARFVRHGLTLCPKVIILNRLAFLEGTGRSDIIDVNLSRVYIFRNRPPMMHRHSKGEDGIWREWSGKKAGSAMAVAFFIFERGHDARISGTALKRISWKTPGAARV